MKNKKAQELSLSTIVTFIIILIVVVLVVIFFTKNSSATLAFFKERLGFATTLVNETQNLKP